MPVRIGSLEGYWSFDEGEGYVAHDSSHYLRDLIITNGLWSKGAVKTGLWLPDRTVIRAAYGSAIDASAWTAFSISWWCNKTAPTGAGYPRVICFGLTDVDGVQIMCVTGTDQIRVTFSDAGTHEDKTIVAPVYSANVSNFLLTYVVASRAWELFKDTVSIGSGTVTLVPVMPNRKIVIGNYDTPAAATGHVGLIDEVQLYSVELTPMEVLELYESVVGRSPGVDLKSSIFGRDISLHASIVDVGTALQNLNDFAVNQVLPVFFGANGFKLDITSSDNTKDVGAGVGAKQVTVYGLDANYKPLVESVVLNGQTAVTTVGTFRRVFAAAVSLVGTDSVQAGDIYIIKTGSSTWTAGVPNTLTAASVVCKILAANGVGYTGYWTVPADKTGPDVTKRKVQLMSITPGIAVQNAKLLIQAQSNLDTDNAMATVLQVMLNGLTGGAPGFVDLSPQKMEFPAGTDIVLKVIPLVAAGQITIDWHLRQVGPM